jgi:hypothetical protein
MSITDSVIGVTFSSSMAGIGSAFLSILPLGKRGISGSCMITEGTI